MEEKNVNPVCLSDDPAPGGGGAVTRSGQSVFMSVYRTKVADECRLITITWCKNLLLHGLSVSIQGPEGESQYTCKVGLKPWNFWRKQGSKQFVVEGKGVDVFWDLKAAKFNGETEPRSEYYVAVVCNKEVVLLVGDLKIDAYRRTRCRPSLIDPILVSRREHVFGKRKFTTRFKKFEEKGGGNDHQISIECKNRNVSSIIGVEPEMEMRIDGHLMLHVKHLQWKFRGNECIHFNNSNNKVVRIQVYWDVHDWLFSPSGLKHALFIFIPTIVSSSSSSSSSETANCASLEGIIADAGAEDASSEFSLFLYAWKVE